MWIKPNRRCSGRRTTRSTARTRRRRSRRHISSSYRTAARLDVCLATMGATDAQPAPQSACGHEGRPPFYPHISFKRDVDADQTAQSCGHDRAGIYYVDNFRLREASLIVSGKTKTPPRTSRESVSKAIAGTHERLHGLYVLPH